jgi:hypothetical protein
MQSVPVWLWLLALAGAVELAHAWSDRREPRTWIIWPVVSPAGPGQPADCLEMVVRRLWRELDRRDRVLMVVDDTTPREVLEVLDRLQARFPFDIVAQGTRAPVGDTVVLRPHLTPSAPIVTHSRQR